jgi:hypothetical protein
MITAFIFTFITLIPKDDDPIYFDQYKPNSLCSCIYKIVSKVIDLRVKNLLSNAISIEQFGFLLGRHTHKANVVSQKGLHSIKTKRMSSIVTMLDLSKTYERVIQIYLKMMLLYLGFIVHFVKWVINCLSSVSFAPLINGPTSTLFRLGRGLRHGPPLSHYFFLHW